MESSELLQVTGDSRIGNNIQQITSRFQSIQMTAKEILKKCETAVSDHKVYREKYNKFQVLLAELREQVGSLAQKPSSSDQDHLNSRLTSIQKLESTRVTHLAGLNAVVEDGERLYPSTGEEGRVVIRAELQALQTHFEGIYDDLGALERDLSNKLNR
jgi:nesprin-1